MAASLEKWQATVLVLTIILAVTVLAIRGEVDGREVITGLIGLGNLLLGAGAVAHGVRQGSKATSDPPASE